MKQKIFNLQLVVQPVEEQKLVVLVSERLERHLTSVGWSFREFDGASRTRTTYLLRETSCVLVVFAIEPRR